MKQTRALNKTEKRWLDELQARGWIPIFSQDITLRLGDDCRYTPDFFSPFKMPGTEDTPTFWEVKGFMREDALVKLKVAARTHAWAQFILVRWKNGQWVETEIEP